MDVVAASFRAELLILRKWTAVWVLGLLPPLLVFFFSYFFSYFQYQSEGGDIASLLPEQMLASVLGGFPLYGGTAAIVLSALVAGGEHGRGTLKTALTQRPGRLATYCGQSLALLVVLAVSVLATIAVGVACSFGIAVIEGEAARWPSATTFARGIGAALLVSAAYAAFGSALGVLLRAAGPAIGAGLVWAFVVQVSLETVAVQSPGAMRIIYKALPGTNAVALISAVEEGGSASAMASPAAAPWVLTAYAIAFIVLGALLLRRRDVA